ncbi:hypothetical protein EYF80_051939 [Liparis tanakae]|uniref:Uncharacterized protein n=1 Tax=Liparis tanakae TaxID=230148 RepID=A0A4Z2FAH1_9TELE|nr:hypothetical protein EYF80_051939 [Liparis tanakae]
MPLIRSTVCGCTMILLRWNRCRFQNCMWTLGQDSVFSSTVASTRTSAVASRGRPTSVKSCAPTSSTFSMRMRSPQPASRWLSIRIRSSPVTFHWRLAKCTTANRRPKSCRSMRRFTALTSAAWRLRSSSSENGLVCSGHGGLDREVRGTRSRPAELCARTAAASSGAGLRSDPQHVLHNTAPVDSDILTGSALVNASCLQTC